MDCNSYSYAPYMLDEDRSYIKRYENDDMEVELDPKRVDVWAFSYDGSMDVYEIFKTLEAAQAFFDLIVENYSSTPPGDELEELIRAAHEEDEAA